MLPSIVSRFPVLGSGCLPARSGKIPRRHRSPPPEKSPSSQLFLLRTKPCSRDPAPETSLYNGWTECVPGWLGSSPPDPLPLRDTFPHPVAASRSASCRSPRYPSDVSRPPLSTPHHDCDIPPSSLTTAVYRRPHSTFPPALSIRPYPSSDRSTPAPYTLILKSDSDRERAQSCPLRNCPVRYASNSNGCRVHPAPSASAWPVHRSTRNTGRRTPRIDIPSAPRRAPYRRDLFSAPRAPSTAQGQQESNSTEPCPTRVPGTPRAVPQTWQEKTGGKTGRMAWGNITPSKATPRLACLCPVYDPAELGVAEAPASRPFRSCSISSTFFRRSIRDTGFCSSAAPSAISCCATGTSAYPET